jgi:hypothetical protein
VSRVFDRRVDVGERLRRRAVLAECRRQRTEQEQEAADEE